MKGTVTIELEDLDKLRDKVKSVDSTLGRYNAEIEILNKLLEWHILKSKYGISDNSLVTFNELVSILQKEHKCRIEPIHTGNPNNSFYVKIIFNN